MIEELQTELYKLGPEMLLSVKTSLSEPFLGMVSVTIPRNDRRTAD
jgi:hypothetical protein